MSFVEAFQMAWTIIALLGLSITGGGALVFFVMAIKAAFTQKWAEFVAATFVMMLSLLVLTLSVWGFANLLPS